MHRLSIFLAAGLLFSFCKKSSDDSGSTAGSANGGLTAYQTSAQIGISGGTISDPQGNWSLTIPPGALTQTKTIIITSNATATGTVPAEYTSTAATLAFEPHGLMFLSPATLKVKYAQGDMPEGGIEEKMQKQFYITDNSKVVAMTSAVNTTLNEITAQVPHFSFSATLTSSIKKVNNGTTTRPSSVRRVANRVISYFNSLGSDAARNAEFQANAALLNAFIQKLVLILGADILTAAFPNADFNNNGVPNSSDPLIVVGGANVTLSSAGSLFVSTNAGAVTSTQFSWRSSASGTYTIRLNGTNCSNGTIVQSGAVTLNVDNTLAGIGASALLPGGNEYRVCVTVGAITNFLLVEIIRDDTAPDAPAPVGAQALSNTQIRVNWAAANDDFADADELIYELCQSAVPGGCNTFSSVQSTAPGISNQDFSGLISQTPYYYRVRAKDAAGNIGAASAEVMATTAAEAPKIMSVISGNGQSMIYWNSIPGATSYNIYWTQDNPALTTLSGTKISNARSPYTHLALQNGSTYYYTVTANTAAGEGIAAPVVSAALSTKPSGVHATPGSTGNVISWNAVAGAALYNVYWSASSGAGLAGTKISSVANSFLHSAVTLGNSYYYVVTAVVNGVESAPSAEISAKPLPLGGNWINAAKGSGALRGLAWNGTEFISVDSYGEIKGSADGIVWTTRRLAGASSDQLYGITWSGTKFVAVGGNFYSGNPQTILTSADGVQWTLQSSVSSDVLKSVIWSGQQFVAVGGASILTSPDGTAWTKRTVSGSGFNNIAWSGTLYVATGPYNGVFTSPDGISWTSRTLSFNGSFNGITWSGSQFVAVGGNGLIATSSDGIVWTQQVSGTDGFLSSIVWSGNSFVAVGGSSAGTASELLLSNDGISWVLTSITAGSSLSSVVWSGTKFLTSGNSNALLSSPDGAAWTQLAIAPAISWMRSLAYSGSQYVSPISTNGIVSSSDGLSWLNRSVNPDLFENNLCLGNAWGMSKFVAICGPRAIVSADGVNWSYNSMAFNSQMNGIVFSGSLFVSVGYSFSGGGVVVTSPDGQNWSWINAGAPKWLSSVTWSGSQYIAVGQDTLVMTSPDATNWTVRSTASLPTIFLSGVASSGSVHVAVGYGGKIISSADGVTWTERASGVTGQIFNVKWVASQFIALGQSTMILTSPDGINWTNRSYGESYGLYDVVAGNNQLVAIGDGAVLISR